MSIRDWLIQKLLRPETDECVATGKTTIRWTDRKNLVEEITWLFYKNTVTGRRRYEVHSYGYAKADNSHRHWEGEAKKYVATGIIPKWAEAVDFEMLKQ
jgi:hypothetical protein